MSAPARRLLVCLDGSPRAGDLVRRAAALARRLDADLIGLRSLRRAAPSPAETFARGGEGIRDVLRHLGAEDREAAAAAQAAFEAAAGGTAGAPSAFRVAWDDTPEPDPLIRDADLLAAGHPPLPDLPEALSAGRLLLTAGRPLVVLPDEGPEPFAGPVLIAWDGGAAAAGAVEQALPLLSPKSPLTVLVVDGAASPGSTRGLMDRLQAAGFRPELRTGTSGAGGPAAVIRTVAGELGAGLLVLGGYGRSPTIERWFGGVTRSLLGDPPCPLLLSHAPARLREAAADA